MSGTDTDDLPGGWEATAAEYVLGLLEDEERAAFEARLRADPDLQQDVAAWSEYFATLTDPIPERVPPPAVLRRLEAELFAQPRRSLWQMLLPYLAGAMVGAALAWGVFFAGLLDAPQPELRAELAPVEGEIAFAARFDPGAGVLALDRIAGTAPEGRVLELWLIPGAEAAPISLGLLAAGGGTVIALPPLLSERVPGATLAVSEEPPGGSPTGAPTGPVRAAGQMATL